MFEPSLRAVDTDLWVAEQPQRFMGLQLGTRMTAIRLGDELVALRRRFHDSQDAVVAVLHEQ